MTVTNQPYLEKAWQGALDDFDQQAGPGNLNDPLFALACRLLELAHAAPDLYSEADAERDACGRARLLGHDEPSITGTWRSAEKTTRGKAAVIPAPSYTNGNGGHAQGYADLAAYAASRGVPAEVFERAGWSDSELYAFRYTDKQGKPQIGHTDQERLVYERRRRALRFATDAGPRWRLIDEDKPSPKYWHPYGSHLDSNKSWYRIGEALALAAQRGYLALVNGEASVVIAQHAGVPALCETGGGEKAIPPQLLQLLRVAWQGPIVVALDCDGKGQKAAAKKREQLRDAGYSDVRAVDLNLGSGGDVADFTRLHAAQSAAQLLLCADLPEPAPAPGQAATPAPAGVLTQSQAIITQLERLGYTFRWNECGGLIEVNGEPLTDTLAATIRTRLRDEGVKRFGAYEDAWTAHADQHRYHPIKEYLNNLRWDGTPRLAQLAACLIGDHPLVTYQDGSPACSLATVYLVRWLIGVAAKVFAQGQQAMLVFTGGQGLGKSSFARWLCPPSLQKRYYLEADINTKDKDSSLRLMTMFLWEVGELDRTTRKQDVAELKQFISQQEITVRRPYGRYDLHGSAMTSLMGTVNNADFLADDTGNRRFYVIDCTAIDWAYQQLPIDQIWAEVMHLYRNGAPWRLSSEESVAQTEHNRNFLADSLISDYIRRHFFVTGDPSHTMTAAEIVDTLAARQVRLPQSDRALTMEISRAMAALGVLKVRANGGRGARCYAGIMPKNP